MTRTIPVSGKFTRRQKQVYNAVLRVLRACSAGLVPGKKWKDWQKEATRLIENECVDLGLLKPAEIKKPDPDLPAVKKYFMHGVGHPLGLDVHDLLPADGAAELRRGQGLRSRALRDVPPTGARQRRVPAAVAVRGRVHPGDAHGRGACEDRGRDPIGALSAG